MPTTTMQMQGAGVGITPFASVLRTLVKEFEMAKCRRCGLVRPVIKDTLMLLSLCSCLSDCSWSTVVCGMASLLGFGTAVYPC